MKAPFGSLEEAVAWLYGTQLFGVKLGLEGTRRLAAACGVLLEGGLSGNRTAVPGGQSPGGNPRAVTFIHVAGTNGKGSTCAMVDAMCRAAGLRTGLYTSPHLVSVQERFQFNGECISESELLDGLDRMRFLVANWEPHPTFFEIVTVLALEWFQCKGAEVVVLETGMGGRLDATNIVTPAACALSAVGLDHQQYLGQTLREIAAEKAGIFKPGVPVVSAPQEAEVLDVFESRAAALGCRLQVLNEPWKGAHLGLRGRVQRWNAALADAVLTAAEVPVDAAARALGLSRVQWPGRFQEVVPGLFLDGAHNPAAAAVLVETWRETFGELRAPIVFGAMADKVVASVLHVLAPIVSECVVVSLKSPRALDPLTLSRLVRAELPGVRCHLGGTVSEALALACALGFDGPRLVTGSLFLVGEVIACLKGQKPEVSVQ